MTISVRTSLVCYLAARVCPVHSLRWWHLTLRPRQLGSGFLSLPGARLRLRHHRQPDRWCKQATQLRLSAKKASTSSVSAAEAPSSEAASGGLGAETAPSNVAEGEPIASAAEPAPSETVVNDDEFGGFSEVFPISDLHAFTADELAMLFGNADEHWSVESTFTSITGTDKELTTSTSFERSVEGRSRFHRGKPGDPRFH